MQMQKGRALKDGNQVFRLGQVFRLAKEMKK
jgi:hypothetical protein